MQVNLELIKSKTIYILCILIWFPLVLGKTKTWSQFCSAYLSFVERRRHLQGPDKWKSGDSFSLFQYRWEVSVGVNLKRWSLVPLSRKIERVLAFVIVWKRSLFICSPFRVQRFVCASESLFTDDKVIVEVLFFSNRLASQRFTEKTAWEWLPVHK